MRTRAAARGRRSTGREAPARDDRPAARTAISAVPRSVIARKASLSRAPSSSNASTGIPARARAARGAAGCPRPGAVDATQSPRDHRPAAPPRAGDRRVGAARAPRSRALGGDAEPSAPRRRGLPATSATVPSATSRPRLRISTREQTSSTSASRCVLSTTVAPRSPRDAARPRAGPAAGRPGRARASARRGTRPRDR